MARPYRRPTARTTATVRTREPYHPLVETVTLTSGGHARSALLSRPPDAGAVPLVVMLHGTGGSAAFAADETGWAAFAADRGFAVAFPDGLPVDPDAPPRFLSNPQRWNDGSSRPGDFPHADTDDVTFLADLIGELTIRRGIDPHRVYLTGFSNGAGMAFRFAAERGDLLAAVAPLAGYCHIGGRPRMMSSTALFTSPREGEVDAGSGATAAGGRSFPTTPHPSSADAAADLPLKGGGEEGSLVATPTLFIVGDADLLIPLAGGAARLPWGNKVVPRPPVADTLVKWAGMLGCDPTPRVVSNADGIVESVYPGSVEFRSVVVAGLGHHWPGGEGQFNPRIGGPPSDRLDANARLWAFFERHRR
jgi:polyhydroxybutyrate depolymerase